VAEEKSHWNFKMRIYIYILLPLLDERLGRGSFPRILIPHMLAQSRIRIHSSLLIRFMMIIIIIHPH